ncbi:hypothetical protein RB653_002984 [Dictyostelium firmibasis]|uniref:Dickkopf N-terminal cysteine-rich domain-containing protein n=1 Tax=Dictyostelium firmibasis TaxID=79012 RepID=A0AAN7TYS8_9MYCE
MKTIIYILIILTFNKTLLLLINCQQIEPNCFKCLKEGEECVPDGFKIGSCSNGLVCGSDPNNEFEKYSCIEPKRYGEPCVDSSVCDIGLLCSPETNQCDNIKFASIGELCSRDLDCSENIDKVSCIDGYCKSKSNKCTSDNECQGGFACIDSECIFAIQLNQSCSGSSVACDSLAFCSESTQLCSLPYSLNLNDSCTFNDDFDYQCKPNLTCSKKGNCIESLNGSSSTSGSNETNKEEKCSMKSCGIGKYCDCDSGKCLNDAYDHFEHLMSKTECIIKNRCRMVENLYSRSSCFTKHCKYIDIEIHKTNLCKNTIFTVTYRDIDQQQYQSNSIKLSISLFTVLLLLLLLSIVIIG